MCLVINLYAYLLISGLTWGAVSYLQLQFITLLVIFICLLNSILINRKNLLTNRNLHILLGISFFIILFSINSISSIAIFTKIAQLLYSLIFCVVGYSLSKKYNVYDIINRTILFYFFFILVCIWVYIFLASGDLSKFKALSKIGDNPIIPDYLLMAMVGYPLLIFKVIKKKYDSYFFLIVFSSLFVVFLGGRGPFAFLILLLAVYLLRHMKGNYKQLIIGTLFTACLLFFTDVFHVVIERFLASGTDVSVSKRLVEYNTAILSINNNLFFGSGLGSSGIILGYGDVYAYPHNMLLEVWLELGFIPFLLLLALYLYCFYLLFTYPTNSLKLTLIIVILFFLLNGLKSASIFEQRYLLFYLGILISLNVKTSKLKVNNGT